MSTKVNKSSEFHLSKEARRRLFGLSQQLLWLLDEDARYGFSSAVSLSPMIGPWILKVLPLAWDPTLKAIRKPFSYLGGADCPRVIVNRDWYEVTTSGYTRLAIENENYYKILREHNLIEEKDLPF